MKKILWPCLLLAVLISVVACKQPKTTAVENKTSDTTIVGGSSHPDWIMQGNIYEVNVRQFSPEGTFNAFATHLDRLQQMGVQTLWFMPINPISKADRKGSLGSYYAVSDYTAINPEFGSLQDFKQLVQTAHDKNMKVIIDWVPNHTGADHRWLTEQPDFFLKDSAGKARVAMDWVDTRQLDYKNAVMGDSMIEAMRYWITHADIDGFRCDVAWNVPGSFWSKCIAELRKSKSIFMLAEGDSAYLPASGFDAVYPWHMFNMMIKIAKGDRPAFALDSIKNENDEKYPENTIQMYFTSNHDENSWNKSDYGTFPGAVHAPFAVFTQTMVNGVPLIYGGQEEPILRPLKFFDKDPMLFQKYQRAAFYKTLLELRKRNAALAADASFRKVSVGDEKSVYAFVREKDNQKIFVILNLSKDEQAITVKDNTLTGNPYNIFMGTKEALDTTQWMIEPWGYVVYEYNAQ
ncbi:MAG TPA: alpha-amylase family glycosyl hydrolase [Chitinophagales bacterium]|nr:alpha-amylase family glycosyl hydrolase [Chitinophagales bacterium]